MYTFLSSHSLLHPLPPFLPVSSMMHEYPPENILWGPYALDWDEQAVRDYLSLLTPERMHLTVVSKVGAEKGKRRGKERKGGNKGRKVEYSAVSSSSSWSHLIISPPISHRHSKRRRRRKHGPRRNGTGHCTNWKNCPRYGEGRSEKRASVDGSSLSNIMINRPLSCVPLTAPVIYTDIRQK